jgi:hypothetical protein
MNRRSLFKFFGIGVATAVVAPNFLVETKMRKLDKVVSRRTNIPSPSICGDMYERPRKGYDYSIGVYVGDEISSLDPSCISIMRKGNGNESDVQAAEFIYGQMSVLALVEQVAYWAKWYGAKCKDSRGPLIVIEQVQGYGDLCQAQLKIAGMTRFHRAAGYIPNKPPMVRDGWYSTRMSTPLIFYRFFEALENGWYRPNSETLKDCLKQYPPEDSRRGCLAAAAQSYVGAHGLERRA